MSELSKLQYSCALSYDSSVGSLNSPKFGTQNNDAEDKLSQEAEKVVVQEAESVVIPVRKLITLIQECPADLMKEISPRSTVTKQLIKLPMILLLSSAGLLSAINISFFKFAGEIIKSGGTFSQPLVYILIAIGLLGAIF